MRHLWTVGIILVMTGCCNSGGIKGAIEYQVDACSKTGFSNFAFDMSGQFAAPQTITVEQSYQEQAQAQQMINAANSAASALERANFCTANPDGC